MGCSSLLLLEKRARVRLPKKTKRSKIVSACLAAFSLCSASEAATADRPNGRDLVERSLAAGERNELLLNGYVNRSRISFKQLETDGTVKSEEIKTFDDVLTDGFHVRTLVAKDDKPLEGADRRKEAARVARLIAQRKQESGAAREKRLAEAKARIEKDHRFTHELLDAFDYRVAGEETVAGRKAWILDAAPHPGYKPKELKAQMFPHLEGRIWIDQEDLLWVKAEARGVDAFSIGFSALAKIEQGARLSFEQGRLPDGVWVARRVAVRAAGRVALVKHFSIDMVTVSDQYRKVAPALRIADAKDPF